MNIGICDDEIKEVELLEGYINDYFAEGKVNYTIIKSYNADEFLKHANDYDIVYLDIDLGRVNGVSVGKELRKRNKRVKLIYVTSHEEYRITALKAYYLQYLRKPVEKEEFSTILHDAIGFLCPDSMIEFKTNRSLSYVKLDDIIYVKTEDRNTYLVKKHGRERIYDDLDEIEPKSNNFAFVHRSYPQC